MGKQRLPQAKKLNTANKLQSSCSFNCPSLPRSKSLLRKIKWCFHQVFQGTVLLVPVIMGPSPLCRAPIVYLQ